MLHQMLLQPRTLALAELLATSKFGMNMCQSPGGQLDRHSRRQACVVQCTSITALSTTAITAAAIHAARNNRHKQ
jgi:hypothetical protein